MDHSKVKFSSLKKLPGINVLMDCVSSFSVVEGDAVAKDGFGLFKENLFRTLLVLERKRSERNNKPFMFIRIDYYHCPEFFKEPFFLKELIWDLSSVTRENDVKGWFKRGRVIGIIISDIDISVSELIYKKIETTIKERVPKAVFDRISIRKDIFPDKIVTDNLKAIHLNSIIYSDCMSVAGRSVTRVLKRSIDIVGSILGIVLFLPVFLIIPLIIKLTSEGPVFFKQRRVGRFGKTFVCLKFRTMKKSNDDTIHREFVKKFINSSEAANSQSPEAIFKIEEDPRVTRVGRFLRKTSLDEIPQFFNVLAGQMSIVGPRPAIPYEVHEYSVWHYRRVFETKPGLTGIWQLNGRSRTDFNNMVRMDIQYINSWSVFKDLKLIIATPLAMVGGRGAY
ncbi:MAG: sugar transferase [Chitinispirillaceae bacterium]|nr:sugar transferase [Chitinispirillaceae bacterium]